MNVYDEAHKMARAIKESNEYQELLKAYRRINDDPKNNEMLTNFTKIQWEVEGQRALGKEVSPDKIQQFEQLRQLVELNPSINAYLSAKYVFDRMMSDIQKIIADAISEWIKVEAEMMGMPVDDKK